MGIDNFRVLNALRGKHLTPADITAPISGLLC